MCDSLGGKVAAGATLLSEKPKETMRLEAHQTSDTGEVEIMRANVSRSGGRPWKEAYPAVVPGLQLRALWNRNHMRGVFRGIKTNTQGLNRN